MSSSFQQYMSLLHTYIYNDNIVHAMQVLGMLHLGPDHKVLMSHIDFDTLFVS